MPETQETFELLKNYIDVLPISLLLFNSKKDLISCNNQTYILLEVKDEDLKRLEKLNKYQKVIDSLWINQSSAV